jgi:hypothetical protein
MNSKIIREVQNRFLVVRLVELGSPEWAELRFYSRKMGRNKLPKSRGGQMTERGTLEMRFEAICGFLAAHPRYSDSIELPYAAERWARDGSWERHCVQVIFRQRVDAICCEAGLDWEERSMNDWSEQWAAAEAEYALAEELAAACPDVARYNWSEAS